jgi:negative regulator of sigma E activity
VTDKRSTSNHVEPERDPRLARVIQAVEGPAPSGARLELLRARIAAATQAVLEGRRERAWWEWMTHWARTEVALAAAATVLAAVISGVTMVGRGEIAIDTTIVATSASTQPSARARLDSVVTRALAVGASSEQVMNAVVGPANDEWLLTAAVVQQ